MERHLLFDRELIQECERHYAKDVIQHCCADHDLRLVGLTFTKVVQHAHRNTDAGGGKRAADEQRREFGQPEGPGANAVTQRKRQGKTEHRHDNGLAAGARQAAQIGIHTHFEQQQDDADLGQQLHGSVGRYPAQH